MKNGEQVSIAETPLQI